MKHLLLLLGLGLALTANAQENIEGIQVKSNLTLQKQSSRDINGKQVPVLEYGNTNEGVILTITVVPGITRETLMDTMLEFKMVDWKIMVSEPFGSGIDANFSTFKYDGNVNITAYAVQITTVVNGKLVRIGAHGKNLAAAVKEASYVLGYIK